MQQKRYLKFIAITGCFLISAGTAVFLFKSYWQPKQTALWNHLPFQDKKLERRPAQFNEAELHLIEDYFRYNSFHKFISYTVNLNLTSTATDRMVHRAKTSLDESLQQLFNQRDKAKTLEAFASPTLTSDFISTLLDRFDQNDVKRGDYQIDLEFEPRNHPSVLFHEEAESAGLWDLKQTNSLKSSIEQQKRSNSLPQGDEYELIRTITSTEYPHEGQYYQYQGGVISLSLGVDHLDWDAQEQRSEKAKQVEGDLIYRRYFKIVHEDEFSFFLENQDIIIRNTAMVRFFDDIPFFVTVDISKEFDGHHLLDPQSRLTIYFGEMLPTKKRRRGFFQRLFSSRNENIFGTGGFKIYGRLGKGEGGIDFEMRVHNLVFDLKTRAFSIEDSRLTVTLKNETILTAFDKAAAINDIKRIILGPLSSHISRKLALSRFHPSLKFTEDAP